MGFSILLFFVILPLTTLCLLLAAIFKNRAPLKAIVYIWGFLFFIIFLSIVLNFFTSKKVLRLKHYYGEYVIDRDFFSGKQADWQYNTFRFEITKADSIFFYITNEREVLEVYKGIMVPTQSSYHSARLNIEFDEPVHHVFSSTPTTHRQVWGFYLVFNSPQFHNMYFRKGRWKALN